MAQINRSGALPFQFQLDVSTGVPVYRQLIDQVLGALSAGNLKPGNRLPTVRQVAVDLAINPNTVVRAYKELEIRGILTTQQGTGTFISERPVQTDDGERLRKLYVLAGEVAARAGAAGFTLEELIERLAELRDETPGATSGR
ncbi:MAG: GntR family transcriptional regulator [Acidobacteriota bacterium]